MVNVVCWYYETSFLMMEHLHPNLGQSDKNLFFAFTLENWFNACIFLMHAFCFCLLSSYHKLASLRSNPFMLCTPFSHPLLSFLFSYPRLRRIRTHQIHPTLLLSLLQLPHFLHQMRRMRKMGKWREKIPVLQSPKMTLLLLLLVCFPLAPSGRYACLWAPLNFFHYVM